MSINHNRIKAADLETNEPNRILMTNSSGELEFTNFNNIQIDSYNDLDYIAEGKALDARQGKVLKDLVNKINGIVTPNNPNLDTIQELGDSIEAIQTSLNTILVNDLTSGGTNKALTAEMGKVLQNTKDGVLIVNSQSGTIYTLQQSDLSKRIVFSNISPVSLLVPSNIAVPLAIGSKIEITQQDNGVITIGGTGITFVTNLSLQMVKGETRILTKIDINTWTIEGNKIELNTTYNTFYIENTIGNDNTGALGNVSKPFKTLQGAIDWFQANTPKASQTFLSNYTFEILDGNAYTVTKPIMQEYTGNVNFAQFSVVNIVSKHSCQITFSNPTAGTTMLVMTSLSGIVQQYSKLNIDMPLGTIIINGINPIQLTQISTNGTRQAYQILNINVAVFTVSIASSVMSLDAFGYYNVTKQGTGISSFKAKTINLNAACDFILAVAAGVEISVDTINFNVAGSTFCNILLGTLSFKKINSNYSFSIVEAIDNNGILNHGDIFCTYMSPFRYISGIANNIETSIAYINYVIPKTTITGGGYIEDFNQSTCKLMLTGNEVEYTNSTKLFGTLNGIVSDNHIRAYIKINNLNIPNGSILPPGSRNSKGIALYNCNLKIGGIITFGFGHTIDSNSRTSQVVTFLEIYGKCKITTSMPVGTEIVKSTLYPANGQGCEINIFGDLTIENGIITTNPAMKINKNNNRTIY